MKLIIAGGRSFKGDKIHLQWLDSIHEQHRVTEVVSGKAPGADHFGEQWAAMRNIPVTPFPADWNKHGRAAGPIRNRQMAGYADGLAAFPGGKGTANMLRQAADAELTIFTYPQESKQ